MQRGSEFRRSWQRSRHRLVRAASGCSDSALKMYESSAANTLRVCLPLPLSQSTETESPFLLSSPVLSWTADMRRSRGSRQQGLGQSGSRRSISCANVDALKCRASLSLAPRWRAEQVSARARSQNDDTCTSQSEHWTEADYSKTTQASATLNTPASLYRPGAATRPAVGWAAAPKGWQGARGHAEVPEGKGSTALSLHSARRTNGVVVA